MKQTRWYILLAGSLILLSSVSYLIQIAVFHRTEDTFFYMLQDIAFVPIQVLFVTLIISELMSRREKISMIKKMNMVVGVFFSEVGTGLLRHFSAFDGNFGESRGNLLIASDWSEQRFNGSMKFFRTCHYMIDLGKGDLDAIRTFLMEKRADMLALMETPNLLEHESFTDLLMSVSHLTDELDARKDLNGLAKPDQDHIALDIKRAYMLLIIEWLSYMKHLKEDYPFLFSFAVRTNPFDPDASVEIK